MDRYAVIGNPVAHSLSPRIHRQFAEQTGESLSYERIEAPLDGFAATVSDFLEGGGRGCNVTLPFKGEAANWVQRCDPLADFAGAVNTIVPFNEGGNEGGNAAGFSGHNTDGPGLVNDLRRLLGDVDGLRVLLVGAGGAARGVARPLIESLAGELVIANRTPARAEDLRRRVSAVSTRPVKALALGDPEGPFDLVINATSAGLEDEVPAIDRGVVGGAFCYDMVYGGQTAFCRWSLAGGAREVSDGLGMLVEQAALAFELWRGVLPASEPVLKTLRLELGA